MSGHINPFSFDLSNVFSHFKTHLEIQLALQADTKAVSTTVDVSRSLP